MFQVILSCLWSCIVHEKSVVREATCPLWTSLIQYVRETELATRVVPALVTLATDPNVQVRASALNPLVSILTASPGKDVS